MVHLGPRDVNIHYIDPTKTHALCWFAVTLFNFFAFLGGPVLAAKFYVTLSHSGLNNP